MAKSDGYEVLVPALTVHKAVGILTDPITGRELGVQQGSGKTYYQGEIIPAGEVSPLLIQALEDEDHPSHENVSKKLAVAGSSDASVNTAARLGLPFAGYDDMDEDDIVAAMAVLPSTAIQAVKRYEAQQDEPRERIVHYNVGFGQSPEDRALGTVGSELDEEGRDDADKVAAKLTTREVPEEGVVTVGDGVTGTGDPAIPHGSRSEEGDKPAPRRRSRRSRSSSQKGSEGSGSDDSGSSDE